MEVDGGGLSSEILRARSLEYYKSCHQQPGTRLHKSGSTTQLNGYHAPKYTPRRTTYTPTPVNGSRPHRTHSERTNNRNVPVSRPQASSPVVSLYRSNSSLDLDHCEASILRRDFGSASSLDVVSSTSGESFFDLLQGFRTGSIDQRSPGPPNIQEYLRGKIDPLPTTQNASNVLANGSDSLEDAQSPRLKTKFHRLWEIKEKSVKPRSKLLGSEPSLFRKLRGGTGHHRTESTIEKADQVLDTEARLDDKLRRKAFAHYDCQSLTANLSYASRLRSLLSRRRNTTTGASAASMVGRMEGPGDVDYGDNRESDLVLSCPFFRNELGGEEERMISLNRVTSAKPQSAGLHKPTLACGLSLLENANLGRWKHRSCPYQKIAWHIENVDVGALCYRQHFYNQEHQNWLGTDEQLGPVALSIKREKMSMSQGNFQYRLILRTSELSVLRGTVTEEALGLGSAGGLPVRTVLEMVAPELPPACLRLASPPVTEHLLRLDEQCINKAYKVGVLYCRGHQSSEEEMYNNETSGPAFDEFLELLGQRVRLKGFEKYRGGLDTKTDTTGLSSIYTTHHDCEIIFHVSTLLPYSPNNKQQLLRKRHIGNDIVTIVFQEPDALPFTPKTIRSHFQHVFVVVRAQNPCSEHTRYRVAISRSKEVPVFGPPIPEGGTFAKSRSFTDFLLTKVINGENAAHRSEKFATMAQRTRQEYLKDLAASYSTTTTVDSNPKFSLLSFGGRKKERCGPSRPKFNPHCSVMGAIAWQVQVEDFGQATVVEAILGVSADTMVVVEETTREVIFACPCNSVLGWTSTPGSLKVFYHQGECILLRPRDSEADEVREMVARLECVTSGCETRELQLRRNSLGQLGFHLGSEGVVTEVEHCGFAWQAGLRSGARLLEICTVAVATLPYEAMVDLLKTSLTVTVAVVPPLTGTQARRGCVLHHCNYLPSGPPTSPGDYENLVDLLHKSPSSLPSTPSKSAAASGLTPAKLSSYTPVPSSTAAATSEGAMERHPSSRSLEEPEWQHRPSPLAAASSNDELSSTEESCLSSEPSENHRSAIQTPISAYSSATNSPSRMPPGGRLRGGAPRPAALAASSSGSTSTLQEDLLKLISPDFLEDAGSSRPSSQPAAVLEEGDIIVTQAQPAEVISCPSPEPPLLPEVGRDLDWNSLVDTATRAMEGLGTSSLDSCEPADDHQQCEEEGMQAHIRKLQYELALEQSYKASLEEQVRLLQCENRRLQEESQQASAEVKRLSHYIHSLHHPCT